MLIDSLILGGRERRFTEVVKGLYMQGFKVEVIILRNAIDYPVIYEYATQVHVLQRKIKKDPRAFLSIFKIYKNFAPDVIHTWGSMCSIYVLPIKIISKVGFLNAMIADSSCKPFSKNWIRAKLTFPFSDMILSNSAAGLKAYGILNRKNAHVIHNGYDFNRSSHDKMDEIKELFKIKTNYVVGMVAAFHYRRDYVTYLNAAIQICRKFNDVTFL